MTQTEIVKKLRDNGIHPSYHRIEILDFLMKKKIHPTVEDIYENLSARIPTLSKTTIYNTLKILVAKKLVSEITIEENEVRYDYSDAVHLHFKCKKCGKLYNVFHNCALLNKKEIDGHLIDEYHLYLIGVCKNCREKEEKGTKNE
jgi:Fur family transcriptional regulator, peroxide stress response regulator